MSNTIRVVAAVLDKTQLTMYAEDGTPYILYQGDKRIQGIIDDLVPRLTAGERIVEVDLSEPTDNTYMDYSAQSGQMVQFFKIARNFLEQFFKSMEPKPSQVLPEEPVTVGTVPTPVPVAAPAGFEFFEQTDVTTEKAAREKLLAQLDGPNAVKVYNAVQEIMANSIPASHPDFHDRDVGEKDDHTIVAVVGESVIPNVQALKPQMKRANELQSSKGLDAFFARISSVIGERRHSIEDLMKFMERGGLPVADDGSIVIYKVLRRYYENGDRSIRHTKYVDCHTGRVQQQVGSRVCMDPSLVDHDRTQECSNGLHVARRQYVGGFSGDVCVLAKVAPEDVIAVPVYDANKMRVCGYDILFELPAAAYRKLCSNQPFTDDEEGQKLLIRALRGDHPASIEEVRIHGHRGTEVVITPYQDDSVITAEKLQEFNTPEIQAEVEELLSFEEDEDSDEWEDDSEEEEYHPAYGTALEEDTPDQPAAVVDPNAVVKQKLQKPAVVVAETQSQKAMRLYLAFNNAKGITKKRAAATELRDFKKAAKKGWTVLGLPNHTGDLIAAALAE